jgi:hypothetical protein
MGLIFERDGNEVEVSNDNPLPVLAVPIIAGGASHFSISGTTGAIAAGAAAKLIFYARNTHATKLALIQRVLIDGVFATTAFAAGQVLYSLHVVRAFTAENGTPGGTALTITGNNQKLRTSHGGTAMGVIRIASTAPLGAPTFTADAQAVGQLNSHSSAGTGSATPIIGSQYVPNNGVLYDAIAGDHPIVLAQNEGVSITVAVPATGVWTAGVTMRWAEVTAYP